MPDSSLEVCQSWQERLAAFLRSVIPADLTQLLFLAGIVCLIFGARMSWWPRHLGAPVMSLGIFDTQLNRFNSYVLSAFGTFAMIFSSCAGYYVCFWPGTRPVRRVLWLVVLPTVAGICLNLSRFAYLSTSPTTLLNNSLFGGYFQSAQWRDWFASSGFHVAFAGLLLTAIFAFQLIRGTSSLPLALPEASASESSAVGLSGRIRFLIWVLVGPLFLLVAIPAAVLEFPLLVMRAGSTVTFKSPLFQWGNDILGTGICLALICWIVAREGRKILWNSARFSAPIYLVIGAGFSIGIAVLISSAHYLFDRAQWAATQFGNDMPPQLAKYFNFPSLWFLLLFFAAFFEELVFRGLLQTLFLRRYGIYRGIFLTGIVWAAYHFNSDATNLNEAGFLLRLAFRLVLCVGLGFVLSWLTLRSGSIWAAWLTHTLYNVLVSDFGRSFPGKSLVWAGMWAVLACLLFRYWPVRPFQPVEQELPAGEPGMAT